MTFGERTICSTIKKSQNLKNFRSVERVTQKLKSSPYFTTFSMKSILHIFAGLEVKWAKLFEPTTTYLALKKQRGKDYLFLTDLHCSIFWTRNATVFVRNIFWCLFKYAMITSNFPKSQVCNTSCVKINTLFAIFNNKGLKKVRLHHSILKEMDVG